MCEHELRGEEAWAFLVNSLAAANARILSYEQQLGEYAKGANDDIRYWRQRAAQAEAQNKRMREALEWYATHEVFFMQPEYDYEAKVGCSLIAKAALEDKP